MRISTIYTQVKKVDIKKKKKKDRENCIRAENTKILCRDFEPIPSKDKAMHKGGSHSF
jgi:hypothetical protein